VNLPVPRALAQAVSREALYAVREAAAQDIQRARALKQFLTAPQTSLITLRACGPAVRMEVYVQASYHSQANLSGDTIAWLIQDMAAAESDVSHALELVLRAAVVRLNHNEALPTGTWQLLEHLSPETWVSRVMESELPNNLVRASSDCIDIEGLIPVLVPHLGRDDVPDDLRRLVRREAAKNLPLSERVGALSELAKGWSNDRMVLLDLVDALAAAERFAEAFLLVAAATRAGVVDSLSDTAWDSVCAVMVDAATRGSCSRWIPNGSQPMSKEQRSFYS
jgi:hypothetical protein